MKELAEVNIIRKEYGVTETDLLDLIFADDNEFEDIYVPINEFMRFINTKREKSNWNELKKWLDEELIKEMEETPADDTFQLLEKTSCLAVADSIKSKMQELENCNNG